MSLLCQHAHCCISLWVQRKLYSHLLAHMLSALIPQDIHFVQSNILQFL